MLRRLLASAILALSSVVTAATAYAQVDPYPLDYWAVRSAMQNVEVSPDGRFVSFMKIGSKTGNPTIEVYEIANMAKEPFRAGGDSLEVTFYNWVGPTQMIVGFRGKVSNKIDGFNQGVYRSRLALLDVVSGRFTPLDNPTGGTGTATAAYSIGLASILPKDPNSILITYREFRRGQSFRPTSYYRYNLKNKAKRLVLKGNQDIRGVRFDSDGYPRVASTFDPANQDFIFLYRKQGDKNWTEMYRRSLDSFEQFDVETLVPGNDNLFYVVANNGEDRAGLWTFNTETKQFVDLIYRHPEVDVTGTASHSNRLAYPNKPVAIGYFKDKPARAYFDDEVSRLEEATLKQLEGIVPNAGVVRITSRSMDGNTMIISNRADTDPGSYYLLANGKFQYLGGRKPLLRPENLAKVEYIQYPARDGRMIPGFVTVPQGKGPFPLIVLPHGGPFVQEGIVFDEWAQMLANNGYMVLQPQYRGSQGYGLEHYQSAFINGGKGGYEMQDDKDDGALYLVQQGRADKDRLAMFGWSYGGYAALIAAARQDQIYQCAIAGAAVADNTQQVNYYRARIRGAQRVEQLRFWDDSISPLNEVQKVNVPLLIIHGSVDQRVPLLHAKKYISALKQAGIAHKYIELEGADHFSNTLFYRHKIKLYEEMIGFLKNDCGPGGL